MGGLHAYGGKMRHTVLYSSFTEWFPLWECVFWLMMGWQEWSEPGRLAGFARRSGLRFLLRQRCVFRERRVGGRKSFSGFLGD